MTTVQSLKILIAPLDWGLGHTTRCVVLAEKYHKAGHQIFFAGNEMQQEIFFKNCPYVQCLQLDGYNIDYPQKGWAFMLKMVQQLPKIQQAINNENRWLNIQMNRFHFDVIIADNRYGLYHQDARSILVTHQLNIQTGAKFSDWIILQKLKNLIHKFDECWVVDNEDDSLAGTLSKAIELQVPLRYIGWLSQFEVEQEVPIHPLDGKNYILMLLSGPEPSRTQMEQIMLRQIVAMPSNYYVLISGKKSEVTSTLPNLKYINLADKATVMAYLYHCQYCISRSGYSTLMDLKYLQKPCVVIPTPGQTEQIYLANRLNELYQIQQYQQHEIDLKLLNPKCIVGNYNNYLPVL